MAKFRLCAGWLPVLLFLVFAVPATAQNVRVQCPKTTALHPTGAGIKCFHLSGGDGFITMADGTTPFYIFGFNALTKSDGTLITDPDEAMGAGTFAANFPAPTISVDEGDEVFLTLTNVGMTMRPDLFDPHSIHWHGFPQAASVFDGVPDSSGVINYGASFTYYYVAKDPGTYFYHCHVEATEHMQMGMLGSLWVRPKQNTATAKFAYNDGDQSTKYDVEMPIQVSGMDPSFHDADAHYQALPFAAMRDRYYMLNGRGYPETVNPSTITTLGEDGAYHESQKINAIIEAKRGTKVLLRISNVSITEFSTLASSLPMQIIALDARLLRDDAGNNLYYNTNSVTLGGGQTADALIDLTGVPVGTYFVYTSNLNHLANNNQNFGGMMTEIRVTN